MGGAPSRIRTCDLCLRRAALYPAELWVPVIGVYLAQLGLAIKELVRALDVPLAMAVYRKGLEVGMGLKCVQACPRSIRRLKVCDLKMTSYRRDLGHGLEAVAGNPTPQIRLPERLDHSHLPECTPVAEARFRVRRRSLLRMRRIRICRMSVLARSLARVGLHRRPLRQLSRQIRQH